MTTRTECANDTCKRKVSFNAKTFPYCSKSCGDDQAATLRARREAQEREAPNAVLP